jgi:hypothetical protein
MLPVQNRYQSKLPIELAFYSSAIKRKKEPLDKIYRIPRMYRQQSFVLKLLSVSSNSSGGQNEP